MGAGASLNRREFLRRITISAVLGAVAVTGIIALVESRNTPPGNQQTTALSLPQITNGTSTNGTASGQTSTQSAPAGYIFLAPLSSLAGQTYAYFNHPNFGSSILINFGGSWKAFSSICTHAGCTVNFTGSQIYCPCHAGYFSAANGAVTGGPPPSKLQEYAVMTVNNNLYVGTSVIN